jgi:hypothetical protein
MVPSRNEFNFRLNSNITSLCNLRMYQVQELSLFCVKLKLFGFFSTFHTFQCIWTHRWVYSCMWTVYELYVNIMTTGRWWWIIIGGGGSWWGHECRGIRRSMRLVFCISIGSNIPVLVYVISCNILLQKSFMKYVGEKFLKFFFYWFLFIITYTAVK